MFKGFFGKEAGSSGGADAASKKVRLGRGAKRVEVKGKREGVVSV